MSENWGEKYNLICFHREYDLSCVKDVPIEEGQSKRFLKFKFRDHLSFKNPDNEIHLNFYTPRGLNSIHSANCDCQQRIVIYVMTLIHVIIKW